MQSSSQEIPAGFTKEHGEVYYKLKYSSPTKASLYLCWGYGRSISFSKKDIKQIKSIKQLDITVEWKLNTMKSADMIKYK
eukprot:snap_masked-scaffold_87-processed-gene-0.2-mRNA-1 protein AED:1.00 eAED:1.00 QI:0/0/0/0/1/1/2/0/79